MIGKKNFKFVFILICLITLYLEPIRKITGSMIQ